MNAPRRRALAAAASLVLTAGTPCVVRAQTTEYRVVFATARELARRLDEAAADGYDCLAVARPEPELVQQGVAVVLGRASAGGPETRHRVVSASGRASDLQPLLDKAGAEGFRLCGVALSEGSSLSTLVAVMTWRADTGSERWSYGVESTDDRKAVARLAAGALEGFRPVAASQLADNRVPEMRSWIVVSERPAHGGSPIDTVFRSAPGPDGLQKALTEQAGKGFRVGLLWKESASIVALMTKPAAPAPAPPEYVVDTAAPDSIARLSGAYLGDFSYLSGGDRVVVREKSITASTMVVEDRLPPLGTPGYAAARELRPLAEHLARNTGGYAVSFVSVRPGEHGALVLRSVLTRLGG